MVRLFLSILIALAVLPTTVVAKTLMLEPSSSWFLDYADDSCRLARVFGADDEKVTVFFDQYVPSDSFKLTVIGKPARTRSGGRDITFQFGPNEEIQTQLGLLGEVDDNLPALVFSTDIRIAPLTNSEKQERKDYKKTLERIPFVPLGSSREEGVTSLRFLKGLRNKLVLQTGPLHKPLEALRNCAWDTVGEWGLDIEVQKNLSKVAKPIDSPSGWVVSSDYPRSMLRQGYRGLVHFRLMIDAAGVVESCHIQNSTRPKEFDDAVCKALMRRAVFKPALNASGSPTRSYYNNTVRFAL